MAGYNSKKVEYMSIQLPAPAIFACPKLLRWFRDTSNHCGDSLTFGGFGPTDGVFERVTPELLAYLDYRLRNLALDKGCDHEAWSRSVLFLHDLVEASGIPVVYERHDKYRPPIPAKFPSWA